MTQAHSYFSYNIYTFLINMMLIIMIFYFSVVQKNGKKNCIKPNLIDLNIPVEEVSTCLPTNGEFLCNYSSYSIIWSLQTSFSSSLLPKWHLSIFTRSKIGARNPTAMNKFSLQNDNWYKLTTMTLKFLLNLIWFCCNYWTLEYYFISGPLKLLL